MAQRPQLLILADPHRRGMELYAMAKVIGCRATPVFGPFEAVNHVRIYQDGTGSPCCLVADCDFLGEDGLRILSGLSGELDDIQVLLLSDEGEVSVSIPVTWRTTRMDRIQVELPRMLHAQQDLFVGCASDVTDSPLQADGSACGVEFATKTTQGGTHVGRVRQSG